jgi:hypothetical protein
MRTVDRIAIAAPIDATFAAASEVERWPVLLPHYRWVRIHERRAGIGGTRGVAGASGDGAGGASGARGDALVEMAAWRPFGPLKYPTWWMSEMWVDRPRWEIRYHHVRGITRGMEVAWRLQPAGGGTRIELEHEWAGPAWPLIRRPAAEWVIGPVFVHGIASRTLAGLKRHLERPDG